MTSQNVVSTYLDKALAKISQLGLIEASTPNALNSFLPLIERIETVDPDNALLIARTMQQSSNFNDVVRTRISSIDIGTRFITISNEFDSIRDDTHAMVTWMSDGKLDWKEKAQMSWMNLKRGTVSERFEKIRTTFQGVIHSTSEQIATEESVLSAYQDFRFSLKEAEASAYTIADKAAAILQETKNKLESASAEVASASNAPDKSRLELARDQLITNVQAAESVYQIAKDISENLKISYNTSELVFERLQQNIAMKRRIHEQSVTFFSTNEIVFTGLSAVFTSTQGLAEGTQALDQMKAGVNQSLEVLADLGGQQLEASARAGYGPTISASSVAKLATAIVDYQSSMQTLVAQLREESTTNANEIETITNDAKARFVELTTRAN